MASQRTDHEANIEPTFALTCTCAVGQTSAFSPLYATYTTCSMVSTLHRLLHQQQLGDKWGKTKRTYSSCRNKYHDKLTTFAPPTHNRISVSKHCIGHYHHAIFNPPPHPLQKQSTKSINTRERDRGPR